MKPIRMHAVPRLRKSEATSRPAAATEPAEKPSRPGWTAALAILIPLVPIAIGIWQYIETSSSAVRQPFLEQQTKLCFAATEAAATLATTDDRAKWLAAKEQFWVLYDGPLAVVEDVEGDYSGRVERMMKFFGNELRHSSPAFSGTEREAVLGARARCIAYACRDLLSAKWNRGILNYYPHSNPVTESMTDQERNCEKSASADMGSH